VAWLREALLPPFVCQPGWLGFMIRTTDHEPGRRQELAGAVAMRFFKL